MMSGLTDEQRKKIEENRRLALAKRAGKSLTSPQQKHNLQLSTHTNTQQQKTFENRLQALEQRHTKPSQSLPLSKDGQNKNWYGKNASAPKMGFNNVNSGNRSSKPGLSSMPEKHFVKMQELKGKCVLLDHGSFSVDVGYHSAIIEFFKQQRTRNYDPGTKTWSFKFEEYDSIMQGLKNFRPDVEIEGFPQHILDAFGPQSGKPEGAIPEADLSSVSPSLVATLKPFQRHGVNLMIHRKGRLLLADDMGLGKTLQAICVADYFREEWPLLVVSPSSVRYDWLQQICKWLPDVSDSDVNVVESSKACATSGLVNIISYDLLSKKELELRKQKFKVIIMDESHFLKNFKTARTKAAMPLLTMAKRVLLLSGTPALSRPVELFCQVWAVCPKLMKFHDFGLRYCDAKKLPWGWNYAGSSNMLELQLFLEKCIMLRRQKKEVLSQLPEKTRQVVVLDPTSIGKNKMLKRAMIIMDKIKSKGAESRNALLGYFQETCRAKMAAVREYILDLLESNKKMLVFGHHREMLDCIEDCIKSQSSDTKYIRIDGSTPSEQRSIFCQEFQTNEDYRLAILSITAANAGLNLSAASVVVFAELFWNPGILVQAEDRAHRMGQKDSVSVQYLLAKGTADDHIWPLIQGKLDVLGKAGLSKDTFSDADLKFMKDPTQASLLDLFTSDSTDTATSSENYTLRFDPNSEVSAMNEAKSNPSCEVTKSTHSKRQASITNFVTTSPKKKRVDSPGDVASDVVDLTETAPLQDDAGDHFLSNDDLAAIACFDWDEQF